MVACIRKQEARPLAEARETLILEHMVQVNLVARRIYRGLPRSVALEDLVSAGVVGLIAAIDRYDMQHKVKLRTYAEYKIRGAILDSLRSLDWAPRQQRKRARRLEASMAELEQRHGRSPSEEEMAQHLGISVDEYQDWIAETRSLKVTSLESSRSEEDGRDLLAFVADSASRWPSTLFERAEWERLLKEAVDKLSQLERTILNLYFYEDMTLRDISRIVGVHESRISQLKTQATLRLRTIMEHR